MTNCSTKRGNDNTIACFSIEDYTNYYAGM